MQNNYELTKKVGLIKTYVSVGNEATSLAFSV
jgi:hypothetical protein